MLQPPPESFTTLQVTDKRRLRIARPNLDLPDRLQLAEVTTAGRLEVATAAVVLVAVATGALLHPAADARSSSTMSVILTLFLFPLLELSLTPSI